jgi:hypothetical protein
MRSAILASVALGLISACSGDAASTSALETPADAGVADAPPPDAAPCLPGASTADCQKCTYGAAACDVACPPSGTVIPWPEPAAYQHACSVHTCCSCQLDTWQAAPLACETECTALSRIWRDIVAKPAVVACARREDCQWVEGAGTCDCAPSISGDCAFAVNLAAYQASGAPQVAASFHGSSCTMLGICDCGPPQGLDCIDGVCRIASFASCF